jgi:hypothetical protein
MHAAAQRSPSDARFRGIPRVRFRSRRSARLAALASALRSPSARSPRTRARHAPASGRLARRVARGMTGAADADHVFTSKSASTGSSGCDSLP